MSIREPDVLKQAVLKLMTHYLTEKYTYENLEL